METMAAPVVDVDAAALATALRRQVDALADMVAATDPARQVPHLTWTAGQVAAHLCVVHSAFAGALRGDDQTAVEELVETEGTLPQMLARTNERALGLFRADSAAESATTFRTLGHALADEVAALEQDPGRTSGAPWYGVRAPATTLACLAMAETLAHGRDIALAAGRPGRIDRAAAGLAAPTVMAQMLPLLVNRPAVQGISAVLRMVVRSPQQETGFDLLLHEATATSLPLGTAGPDCVVRVDADAALLIGFGRISVARALLTGRTYGYGRAPWLALRFGSLFLHP